MSSITPALISPSYQERLAPPPFLFALHNRFILSLADYIPSYQMMWIAKGDSLIKKVCKIFCSFLMILPCALWTLYLKITQRGEGQERLIQAIETQSEQEAYQTLCAAWPYERYRVVPASRPAFYSVSDRHGPYLEDSTLLRRAMAKRASLSFIRQLTSPPLRISLNTPDASGNTPLSTAIRCQQAELVQWLLEQGVPIPHKNILVDVLKSAHLSTEEVAAREGDLCTIIRCLLAANASLEGTDRDYLHRSPLHLALIYSSPRVSALLIDAHADIHLRDDEGNTPLHWAAARGNVQSVEHLLANDATPDYLEARNGRNRTALHQACGGGQLVRGGPPYEETSCVLKLDPTALKATVASLLKHHASVQAQDRSNRTPWQLAYLTSLFLQQQQHPDGSQLYREILALLEEQGATQEEFTPLWGSLIASFPFDQYFADQQIV